MYSMPLLMHRAVLLFADHRPSPRSHTQTTTDAFALSQILGGWDPAPRHRDAKAVQPLGVDKRERNTERLRHVRRRTPFPFPLAMPCSSCQRLIPATVGVTLLFPSLAPPPLGFGDDANVLFCCMAYPSVHLRVGGTADVIRIGLVAFSRAMRAATQALDPSAPAAFGSPRSASRTARAAVITRAASQGSLGCPRAAMSRLTYHSVSGVRQK